MSWKHTCFSGTRCLRHLLKHGSQSPSLSSVQVSWECVFQEVPYCMYFILSEYLHFLSFFALTGVGEEVHHLEGNLTCPLASQTHKSLSVRSAVHNLSCSSEEPAELTDRTVKSTSTLLSLDPSSSSPPCQDYKEPIREMHRPSSQIPLDNLSFNDFSSCFAPFAKARKLT